MIAVTTTASMPAAAKRRHQPAQSRGATVASPGSTSAGGASPRSRTNQAWASRYVAEVMNWRIEAIRSRRIRLAAQPLTPAKYRVACDLCVLLGKYLIIDLTAERVKRRDAQRTNRLRRANRNRAARLCRT